MVAVICLTIGLLPIIRVFQAWNCGKADYHTEIYLNYDVILSIIILLGSITGAITLFGIARRQRLLKTINDQIIP